jgi:hypothetical protein
MTHPCRSLDSLSLLDSREACCALRSLCWSLCSSVWCWYPVCCCCNRDIGVGVGVVVDIGIGIGVGVGGQTRSHLDSSDGVLRLDSVCGRLLFGVVLQAIWRRAVEVRYVPHRRMLPCHGQHACLGLKLCCHRLCLIRSHLFWPAGMHTGTESKREKQKRERERE